MFSNVNIMLAHAFKTSKYRVDMTGRQIDNRHICRYSCIYIYIYMQIYEYYVTIIEAGDMAGR